MEAELIKEFFIK